MRKFFRSIIESCVTGCAKVVLKRHHPTVIAITGSAGKTTTKELVGAVLRQKYGRAQVLVGHGNLGTTLGVPMALLRLNISLLDLKGFWVAIILIILPLLAFFKMLGYCLFLPYARFVVVEVSADRPGDILPTARYLKPWATIVTNIGPAHLELFKTVEAVAREKQILVEYTQSDGYVFLSQSDNFTKQIAEQSKAKIVYINQTGIAFGKDVAQQLGKILGIDLAVSKDALQSAYQPKARFEIKKGINDTTIIDSSYNANPVSVKAVLEKVKELTPKNSRLVVVLGDMLELGKDAKRYHEEIGRSAAQQADYFVAIGPLSAAMKSDFHTLEPAAATEHLLKQIRRGDTILVKASHGMHLDSIVKALEKEHHAS